MEEIIGVIAIGFGAAGYVWTNPRMVLRFAACATAMWIVYFLFLGQIGAALSTGVGLASIVCGVWISDKYLWPMIWISSIVALALLYMASTGAMFVLLSIGYVFKTVALGYREHPLLFRCWIIAGELSYLVFGVMVGAYSTIVWSSLVGGMAFGSGVLIIKSRWGRGAVV